MWMPFDSINVWSLTGVGVAHGVGVGRSRGYTSHVTKSWQLNK